MKYLLLFIFIIMSFSTFSQQKYKYPKQGEVLDTSKKLEAFQKINADTFKSANLQLYDMRTMMYNSGIELRKFHTTFITGTVVTGAGLVLTYVGASSFGNNNSDHSAVYIGGLAIIIGGVIELGAYKHIEEAGIMLTNDKIGISLNRPRKVYHKIE